MLFRTCTLGRRTTLRRPHTCAGLYPALTYDAAQEPAPVAASGECAFTRQLTLAPRAIACRQLVTGQTAHTYTYDACGNLLQETSSRHFEWNHRNQMKVFRIQAGTAEPSIHTHYFYDGDGQRVKKLVRKQGGQVEATIYIDDLFEHHRVVQAATTLEHHTLHVKDDEARVAQVRTGSPFPGDGSPAVQYHVNDHLGSSNLVVNEDGSFINREEYTPYGETCFGSFASKRYRFTGKERDAESGLSYHGARYFAPWLGRSDQYRSCWSRRWIEPVPVRARKSAALSGSRWSGGEKPCRKVPRIPANKGARGSAGQGCS